jgi:hypothetical protein
MLRPYPLITHDSTSAGMKTALAVSILAHGLMLLFFMQHLLTPPASRSSGSHPLHMSLKATPSLMPAEGQRTEDNTINAPKFAKPDSAATDVTKTPLSKPAETSDVTPTKLDVPLPEPTPQAEMPSATSKGVEQVLSTSASQSTQTNAANAALLPPQMGGQGRWGSRHTPANRGPQNMNQGPATVMPLLNRLAGQLPPTAFCDIEIIASWSTAFISCNEDSFKGHAVGFLSQQLRIQPTMADPAHCFKLNNGSLNTVDCRK